MADTQIELCTNCGQPLSEEQQTKKSSKKKRFKAHVAPLCYLCQEKLNSQQKNTQTKQEFGTIKVYCPKCNTLFDSEVQMLTHYDQEHSGRPKTTVPQTIPQIIQNTETKNQPIPNIPQNNPTHPKTILTKSTSNYLGLSLLLVVAGIFLRSPPIIYTSLVPMFFMLIGVMLKQPKIVIIDQKETQSSCYIGETIEVANEISIDDGYGYLIIRHTIPEHFEIAEGSNLKVICKGLKPKKDTLTFKIRCTKRGLYSLGKIDWEFRHILGLRQTLIGQVNEQKSLLVQLRTIPIRRIRNTKTLSKLPLPLGALNKSGISTTDFKEIREYSSGDPFKSINWKITSRMSSQSFLKPYINEFEKEGKKFVWIFIDGSNSMGSHGTVISNAFENAITAANDLSQYYLERDCFVGVYMYNRKHQLIYPDIGRKQRFKISKGLLTMEMDYDEPLNVAIQRCRSHLMGNAPLSIIITALSEGKTDDLIAGIKELKKYNKARLNTALIINVKSYSFAASDEQKQFSAKILQCKDYPIVSRLRETGATVIDWNPVEQPLTHVLLSEVKRR
jgi:uncharacterized protein (DUF58 family)